MRLCLCRGPWPNPSTRRRGCVRRVSRWVRYTLEWSSTRQGRRSTEVDVEVELRLKRVREARVFLFSLSVRLIWARVSIGLSLIWVCIGILAKTWTIMDMLKLAYYISYFKSVLSLQVEPGLDPRSEFKWSLNRADYRHSSTLQDLDDSFIDPFINSLAVGSDLNSLVNESFDYIKRTFEFCIAIEDCLIRTRNNHEINQSTVKCLDEEVRLEVGTDKKKFVKTLAELKRFKAAEKPFFEKLLGLKGTICGKKNQCQRMVSNALFVPAFSSVLVFSVMASALTAAIILA
ncbi:hypothetical protein PVK06_006145 [Gossypium arboreum]|uniref:Uncharacterized protein n=1 Tax=Gossypium arboreum TaxID=29729 RepID=A0ABR0QWI1_GOSAR|nr:hypothetical protein PVK06_006145 [Gossypium arboreum]